MMYTSGMSKEGINRVITSMVISIPDKLMVFLEGRVPPHLTHNSSDLDDEDRAVLAEAAQQTMKDFSGYSFKDRHVLDDAFNTLARRVQGYIEDRYRE